MSFISRIRACVGAPRILNMTSRGLPPCKLVVFDKDGTLLNDNATWAPVLERAAPRLAPYFPTGEAGFLDYLGFDVASRTFRRDSIFTVATNTQISDQMRGEISEAAGAAYDAWAREFPPEEIVGVPIVPLDDLFGRIRADNLKIAMLTSDNRSFSESFLKSQNVLGMVDTIVCGDDGLAPKPQAEPLLEICRRLGVPPEAAAMVGDSNRDMGCAQAASLGYAIGVLSGIHTEAVLFDAGAHVVVPTIAEVQTAIAERHLNSAVNV